MLSNWGAVALVTVSNGISLAPAPQRPLNDDDGGADDDEDDDATRQ